MLPGGPLGPLCPLVPVPGDPRSPFSPAKPTSANQVKRIRSYMSHWNHKAAIFGNEGVSKGVTKGLMVVVVVYMKHIPRKIERWR